MAKCKRQLVLAGLCGYLLIAILTVLYRQPTIVGDYDDIQTRLPQPFLSNQTGLLSASVEEKPTPAVPQHSAGDYDDIQTRLPQPFLSNQTGLLSASVEEKPTPAVPQHRASYVLVKNYDDQLGQATVTFLGLINITVHWDMTFVEPFVIYEQSTLSGIPHSRDDFHFGDFFNISGVSEILEKCALKENHVPFVSSFREFLVNANRQFVTLHLERDKRFLTRVMKPGEQVSQCTAAVRDKLYNLENDLNKHVEEVKDEAMALHGQQYKFRGVRGLCANPRNISLRSVENAIFSTVEHDNATSPLTVVIPHFQEAMNIDSPINVCEWRTCINDPDFAFNKYQCRAYSLPHSHQVLNYVDEFRTSLNVSGPLIGIHFRSEKLAVIEYVESTPGYTARCLGRFEKLIHFLMKKYIVTLSNVVAIHDFGKYGTSSCAAGGNRCVQTRNAVLGKLRQLGIRVVLCDPADFGVPVHRGLISLIEQEFLSTADYLLTLGGGNYQENIVERFHLTRGEEHYYGFCLKYYPDHMNNLNY